MRLFWNIFINKLLRSIFPIECVLCHNNNNKENMRRLCQSCENKLQKNNKIINTNISDWIYHRYNYKDAKVKRIAYLMKYNHHKYLAQEMGSYTTQYIESRLGSINDYIIVPIPLHKRRQRERGYNQAEEIARGIYMNNIHNLLIRTRHTNKLFSQGLHSRTNELKDVFSVNDDLLKSLSKNMSDIYNSKILLIDDITTTGNTLFNARKTLQDYGFNPNNIKAFSLCH